jgi:N-formylglutamate deformylase
MQPFARFESGDSPIVAAAIHHGHAVRDELVPWLLLDEPSRLREEDPYTAEWTDIAPNRAIGLRSRFEVDLNRPREKAVYRCPADCWDLCVWSDCLPEAVVERSLGLYDEFYAELRRRLDDLLRRHGRVVVLDLHTYNHRREGPGGPRADPEGNPEINVGTGTMPRSRWARLVDGVLADLSNCDFLGRRLDVRENVRFQGGQLPRWVHETYPETACCLAIEVKKFFMDEWTGVRDERQFAALRRALADTLPGIARWLKERSHEHAA